LLCCSPGSSIENEGLWARTELLDDGRDKDRSLACLTGDKFLSPLPLLTELVWLGLEDIHLELIRMSARGIMLRQRIDKVLTSKLTDIKENRAYRRFGQEMTQSKLLQYASSRPTCGEVHEWLFGAV